MEEYNDSITKPSALRAIVLYVLVFLFGASFILMGVASIVASINNIDSQVIIDGLTETDFTNMSLEVINYVSITQGVGNLLAYFITLILVLYYLRDEVKLDIKKIFTNKKFFIIFTLASTIIFLVVTLVVETILSRFVSESSNQQTIVEIMSGDGKIPMIIATIFFAPVLEELVYRKAIFKVCKKYNLILAYVVSIVAFFLPHMLTTSFADPLEWILIAIPYILSAALLAVIYHKSNENIYASIFVHMINNTLAVILIFI